VKYVNYFAFILFLITACSSNSEDVLTTSSTLNTQNLDTIVDYSYNLLVEKGIEPAGLSYDTSDFATVEFPDGKPGVFVTIGVSGIDRGYQLLYRIEKEQFELIEPIRAGRYIWGLQSGQNEKRTLAQVDIELLDIFAKENSEWQDILKVTGAGHAGVGLWDDGYFEILAVTNNGLQELFTGVEFTTNSTTKDDFHEYQFIDLDGDGNQEIVETIETCEYRINKDTWSREDLGCQQFQVIYKFDGNHYMSE